MRYIDIQYINIIIMCSFDMWLCHVLELLNIATKKHVKNNDLSTKN